MINDKIKAILDKLVDLGSQGHFKVQIKFSLVS